MVCIRRADAFHPNAGNVIPAMTLVAVNPIKTVNWYFTEIFRRHFRELPWSLPHFCELPVPLFGPWTIRPRGGLFGPLTIRLLDYSASGLQIRQYHVRSSMTDIDCFRQKLKMLYAAKSMALALAVAIHPSSCVGYPSSTTAGWIAYITRHLAVVPDG